MVITYFRNRIKMFSGQSFVNYGEKEESNVTQSFLLGAARCLILLAGDHEPAWEMRNMVRCMRFVGICGGRQQHSPLIRVSKVGCR